MRPLAHYGRLAVINVVVTVLLIVIVEGIASVLLVGLDVTEHGLSNAPHVQYDAELGWIGAPNVTIPDAFGPGMSIRTNSQGFRENRDVSTATPPGHVRMICSGDSFTFGQGVDGDHAWCRLLTALNSRLETVNMGQSAYGIDQAYLWYTQAAATLQHQVHLFAFITDDVDRMRMHEFVGVPKPYLTMQDGKLTVTNVPVPRHWRTPWRADLGGLRVLEFGRRVRDRVFAMLNDEEAPPASQDEQTRQLLHHVFGELRRTNEARGSRLVLVYLPTEASYQDQREPEWLAFFAAVSHALGIPLIDLVTPFASLPHDRFARMFIPDDGHYTVEGHELIATLVYRALETSSALGDLLMSPAAR